MCVFFTFNRSFYPSKSSTISARADSSILEETSSLVTKLRHRDNTLARTSYTEITAAVGNAMSCHHTILIDTTGTIYTFYDINKRKETEQTAKKQKRQNERDKKSKNNNNKTVAPPSPPRGRCDEHLKRKSWGKKM